MMDEELRPTIVCVNDEPESTLTYFITTSIFLDHIQCRKILLSFYFQVNFHTFEVELHEDMV